MAANLVTALGYLTTENHPVYKDNGYPAESGNHYHIKIVYEGQGRGDDNKRCYVYIRSAESTKQKRQNSVRARAKRRDQTQNLTNAQGIHPTTEVPKTQRVVRREIPQKSLR